MGSKLANARGGVATAGRWEPSFSGGERDITGDILEVVDRKRAGFTGELRKRGGLWIVLPDGKELTQPIVVKDPTVKNAGEGDKVVIEITKYPQGNDLGEGVITKVLGEAGLPDVETQAVIAAFELPGEFPKECVEQGRAAAAQYEVDLAKGDRSGWTDRIDMRNDFIITIDPNDSKDFDDAISIHLDPDGTWRLGVHIADVAHFIPPGSALDVESRLRGNSCYLLRLVIPMLPEVISNGICSLSEGVARFCKSAFMHYSAEGKILSENVGQTLIKSAKRLTYLEAQALIDGDLREARKHAKTEPKYTDQLIKTLRQMDTLAKAIRQRRRKQGMIHLDLPEVSLKFDDAGHVIDAEPEDTSFTHTLIEMFMVEANEAVARLLDSQQVPLMRRTHPEPEARGTERLRQFVTVAGFKLPKILDRKAIQALLASVKGKPESHAISLAVLKSLTRAEYSPEPIGHYALASEQYCHFTSPIRRYADLTIHRLLDAYFEAGGDANRGGRKKTRIDPENVPSSDDLMTLGKHLSFTERRGDDAERDLRQVKILELHQHRIGEEFSGVATGITNFGVFVQIQTFLIDGLIRYEDLMDDWWDVDEKSGQIRGQRTGQIIRIGDLVKVIIVRVDIARRELSLSITQVTSRPRKAPPVAQPGAAPKPTGRGKAPPPKKQIKKQGPPPRGGGKRPPTRGKRRRR